MKTREIINSASYPYCRENGCEQCKVVESLMQIVITEKSYFKGDDEVIFLCEKHSHKKTWIKYREEIKRHADIEQRERQARHNAAILLVKSFSCTDIEKRDGEIIITLDGDTDYESI